MGASRSYDVAIVGASLGGAAAAALFARRVLRVALLERAAEPTAYKRICTHYIQGSAAPTLRRLGVVDALTAAGGRPNGAEIWTRFGWVRPTRPVPAESPTHGYNVPRRKLDPLLRDLAVKEGAELLPGHAVRGLLRADGRVAGVAVRRGDGAKLDLRARLVVGADGRASTVARLAGVPARTRRNDRFACFAWYRGLTLTSQGNSQFWCLEPDWGYAYPYTDGLTLMCAFVTRDKLPEWTDDWERRFEAFLAELPDGPAIRDGERVSDVHRMLSMPNTSRPAAAGGVAFVGDARWRPIPSSAWAAASPSRLPSGWSTAPRRTCSAAAASTGPCVAIAAATGASWGPTPTSSRCRRATARSTRSSGSCSRRASGMG